MGASSDQVWGEQVVEGGARRSHRELRDLEETLRRGDNGEDTALVNGWNYQWLNGYFTSHYLCISVK